MKFSANNAKNITAIKIVLIYCVYYQHDLERVGAAKNYCFNCDMNKMVV